MSELKLQPAGTMDKEKVLKYLSSLPVEKFADIIKSAYFNYPNKTREMSTDIGNSIKHDFSTISEEFDKMVDDRNVERSIKLKDVRTSDLQRIENMKSRIGINPLQLFPKEIWLTLFKYMAPTERFHFYYLHEVFADLMKENKIRDILFPMAVSFEVVTFWRSIEEIEEQNPMTCALARNSTLRLVSKSMRNAIDAWHEDNFMRDLREGVMTLEPINGFCLNLEKITDCIKVREIIHHLETSTSLLKMRIFTRSLRIISPYKGDYNSDSSPEDLDLFEQMDEKINQMLDRIGDQIWFLFFDFVHPSYSMREASTVKELASRYTSVLGWLAKMPNLRWLKIRIAPILMRQDIGAENVWYHDHLQPAAPPLPVLERLDLELTKNRDGPLAIIQHLLHSYRHVKNLNLSGLNSLFEDGRCILNPVSIEPHDSTLEISSLGVASKLMPDSDDEIDEEDAASDYSVHADVADNMNLRKSEEDVDLLQIVIANEWKLKRLVLRLEFTRVEINLVFQMIGTVKTLKDLCLVLINPVIGDEVNFLDLPSLSRFTVGLKLTQRELTSDFPNAFFSLDFLKLAKELKNIDIAFDMKKGNWKKILNHIENVEFLGKRMNFDKLLVSLVGLCDGEGEAMSTKKCNIWQVFADLDRLQLNLLMRDDAMKITKSVWEDCKRCEIQCNF